MSAGLRRVRVLISGGVQGVSYRASARREAQRLGVCGWVRNLADGRVEAVLEGRAEAVEQMLTWCHRGPEYARVDGVEAVDEAPGAQPEDEFRVRASR